MDPAVPMPFGMGDIGNDWNPGAVWDISIFGSDKWENDLGWEEPEGGWVLDEMTEDRTPRGRTR